MPFGKHKCLQLLMGFLNSPSWAPAAMDELFSDVTDVKVSIDNIGAFSDDCEVHVATVCKALQQLEQHNFSIKASKCHWCKSEAPWLAHIVTSTGVLPNPDKIKLILQLEFPKTIAELRSFIGMVNFHRSF